MELTLVILAGAAIPVGLVLIESWITNPYPTLARGRRLEWRREVPRVAASVVVGTVVLLATRWVLPSLLVGGIVWRTVGLLTDRGRRTPGELDRVEALATWTEQLRDVLLAGDQPIGAIQATVATAPEVIRPQVRALAARLGRQPEQVVFRQWADDLDDPLADLIAAGLLVALTKGGRAEAVLSSLAGQARQQAERRKLLEAERAPARREVWWVTALMSAQVVAGLLLARSDYLAPYRTTSGQLVLCMLLGVFIGLIVYVQRLARFSRPARFLTIRGLR